MSHCLGKAMESQILKGEKRTNQFLCSLLFYQGGGGKQETTLDQEAEYKTDYPRLDCWI